MLITQTLSQQKNCPPLNRTNRSAISAKCTSIINRLMISDKHENTVDGDKNREQNGECVLKTVLAWCNWPQSSALGHRMPLHWWRNIHRNRRLRNTSATNPWEIERAAMKACRRDDSPRPHWRHLQLDSGTVQRSSPASSVEDLPEYLWGVMIHSRYECGVVGC